jgi:hypothetical protein
MNADANADAPATAEADADADADADARVSGNALAGTRRSDVLFIVEGSGVGG